MAVGPLLRRGGADLDIVTVSVPAVLDGRVVDVATADLDLGRVAELCASALRRVGAPCALVGGDGAVVATSDPSRFPLGRPAPVEPGAEPSRHRSVALDWSLLVV